MALPTYNNFSLNDETYITETVEHRTRAPRGLESEVVARRMGLKLLNTQIRQKVIQVSGHIIATSASALQSAVDDLHKNVSIVEGDLVIESDRTFVATAERIRVPDRTYNQTISEFEIQFVCTRPYAESSALTAGFVIPSGTQSLTITTNISGSAPNRPVWNFVLPSGVAGNSPVIQIDIQYSDTANTVSVSGTFQVGDTLVANYDRYLVTVNGTNNDFVGQMDEIAAGDATFILTISGRNDGLRGTINYNPRYY